MDAERERAIRERVGKATPGPWSAIKLAEGDAWYCYTNYWAYLRATGSTWWSREDAELMAAAREDVPDLLAEVTALRRRLARCARLEAAVTRWMVARRAYRDLPSTYLQSATSAYAEGERLRQTVLAAEADLAALAGTPAPPALTEHPEAICQRCGGPNVVWHAPNAVWNAVMGSPNGIVCPICFVRAAEARGIGSGLWELHPDPAFDDKGLPRTCGVSGVVLDTEEDALSRLQERHGLAKTEDSR